ncbi:Pseudouridine synthase [Entamoeba marina]
MQPKTPKETSENKYKKLVSGEIVKVSSTCPHTTKRCETSLNNDVISEEQIHETYYIFNDEYRRVQPYFLYIFYVFVNEFKVCNAVTTEAKIKRGDITVNNNNVDIDYIIKHHDVIRHTIHRHEPPVLNTQIKIISDTDDLLVVDKPASIPVHPCGRYRHNSVSFILAHQGYTTLRPVHRLDRMTSGVLLFAKTIQAARNFQEIMKSKISSWKVESCSVDEKITQKRIDNDRIHVNLNIISDIGKECHSTFIPEFYDEKTNTTVVRATLGSGRTHQLRVHLQSIGHPIANDPIYASKYDTEKCDDEGIETTPFTGIVDWDIVEGCDECQHLKGDPIQFGIYLHAWKYSTQQITWQTDLPYWAQPNADISNELKEWKNKHEEI